MEELIIKLYSRNNCGLKPNSKYQVVISSILPRTTGKLANQLLKPVNHSLKQLCESQSYYFLDTAVNFLKDGTPVTSIYKDNVHLNSKSRKIFGESICHKLYDILHLPLEIFKQADHHGGSCPATQTKGRKM